MKITYSKFIPWIQTPTDFNLKIGNKIMYDGRIATITKVYFGGSHFDINFKSGENKKFVSVGNRWNDVRFKVKE